MSDGSTLVPANEEGGFLIQFPTHPFCGLTLPLLGLGLKGMIELIDNRSDFKVFMQNYSYAYNNSATPRGPRRDGPREEGFVRVSICIIANN
jgi:hypothetical protein